MRQHRKKKSGYLPGMEAFAPFIKDGFFEEWIKAPVEFIDAYHNWKKQAVNLYFERAIDLDKLALFFSAK